MATNTTNKGTAGMSTTTTLAEITSEDIATIVETIQWHMENHDYDTDELIEEVAADVLYGIEIEDHKRALRIDEEAMQQIVRIVLDTTLIANN